jgi:hypothetical protein
MGDIESITQRMASEEPARQIPAIEEAAHVVRKLAEAAVAALEHGPNRYLVFERLHLFGSICVKPLEHLLDGGAVEEARVLASATLLQLGSRKGIPLLLDTVRGGGEHATLAASFLARERVEELVPLLEDALDQADLKNIDRVNSFVDALREMGREPSESFVARIQSEPAPWQVQCVVLRVRPSELKKGSAT